MMLKRFLRRDDRGIGAVEFALVAPVLISFVIGISQMGRLFFANADMKNAMAAGARLASVFPVPEDATIIAAVNDRLLRAGADARSTPTVVRGTDANGNQWLEVRMTYTVPLEFIFFDVGPVTLTDTRRVFIQETNALQNNNSSGSTGGTTTTTTGGTTGSTTSSGDPGSTTSSGDPGSTTSGSSGTTTSATSASSTGGTTTSTTSASSTTSSGNGNSNGNSSHGHGNCNKKC